MKKLIFIMFLIIMGCGAPMREYQETQYRGRFSDDPLLDSVYELRYNECLRRCADGKKCD